MATKQPSAELFEITAVAAKDTFEVQLVNADDAPLMHNDVQLSVTVFGPGSAEYTKAQAARNQRMINLAAKRKRYTASAEEQVAEQAKWLAAVTKSFNGWAYKGGTDSKAIFACYSDPQMGFIADQVQKAVGDWANFSQSGSTT